MVETSVDDYYVTRQSAKMNTARSSRHGQYFSPRVELPKSLQLSSLVAVPWQDEVKRSRSFT